MNTHSLARRAQPVTPSRQGQRPRLSQLVDDPSADETLTQEEQEVERRRLFGILERLVIWENSNDPDVLAAATAEIDRCYPDRAPPILDPFGGGGAIPLEAQRLGLKALSGDLNPVAVLIQKAMLEIPPRFAGKPPVNPAVDTVLATWERAQGLAADIEAYGQWMRDQAHAKIDHHYPDATGPNGEKLTPIAWIWARTVQSPDPAWNGHVPLVASWTLANKKGKPKTWIEPIIDRNTQTISYQIHEGGEPSHERTVQRGNGTCIATGATIPGDYIKAQGSSGRFGHSLLAVVAEGDRSRSYLIPTAHELAAAEVALADWLPTGQMSDHPQYMGTHRYGLNEWWKLFTPRQLVTLTTFSDLLVDVRSKVLVDAVAAGLADDGIPLREGGIGAEAYADAIITYLAFAVDRLADRSSSICTWDSGYTKIRNTFGRQAIPMTWDFAEGNPFSSSTGNWLGMVSWVVKAVAHLPASGTAEIAQQDARARVDEAPGAVISTDPPYYDSVPYADISDFFFVWLRRNLGQVWPEECATLLTPKSDELVADSKRFGSKEGAEAHFESGMSELMKAVAYAQDPTAPATIYYAYKSTERGGSTGWATFLQAVLDARLQVTATWPLRTELANRMRGIGSNALASSIVLACRPRSATAPLASTGEFLSALRDELPEAVRLLQSGNIAPVDMAQSTIGPGIKVFSRYSKVVEADGSAMSVSDALANINNVLGEILDGEDAELDADTRFAITWYSQNGYNSGPSGDADAQARPKGTSIAGLEEAGIAEAKVGRFRLFERSELDPNWSPTDDDRLTVWESTQYLIAALERSESEAAELMGQLGGYADRARSLAYVLFKKATDKGWAEAAGAYNGLIAAWPSLKAAAAGLDDGQQRLM